MHKKRKEVINMTNTKELLTMLDGKDLEEGRAILEENYFFSDAVGLKKMGRFWIWSYSFINEYGDEIEYNERGDFDNADTVADEPNFNVGYAEWGNKEGYTVDAYVIA